MSLKQLVEQQVKCAFELMGDLTLDMAFKTTPSSEYNFTTGQVEEGTMLCEEFRGVIMKTYTMQLEDVNGMPTVLKEVVADKSELPSSFEKFDVIVINEHDHPVVSFEDNGYTVTFTVSV